MAKKDNNQVCFRTSIGGQALMEGILMRGPDKQAIVCRTENGLTEKVEPLNLVKDRHPCWAGRSYAAWSPSPTPW